MTTWQFLLLALVAIAALGWVFRAVGQSVTGNAPFYRDMPYGVAFGYVLAVAAILGSVWLYLQEGAVFFRWAVQGLIGFSVAAYLFRLLGQSVGPEAMRKLFRQMPLTASFGILVIIIYAILSIFAGPISPLFIAGLGIAAVVLVEISRRSSTTEGHQVVVMIALLTMALFIIMFFVGPLAPHGQEEVFPRANIVPGGDVALGGDPEFPLGTDQIGPRYPVPPDLRRAKHGWHRLRDDLPGFLSGRHFSGSWRRRWAAGWTRSSAAPLMR